MDFSQFKNRYIKTDQTGLVCGHYNGEIAMIQEAPRVVGQPIVNDYFICVSPLLRIATASGWKYGPNPTWNEAGFEEDENGNIKPRQ